AFPELRQRDRAALGCAATLVRSAGRPRGGGGLWSGLRSTRLGRCLLLRLSLTARTAGTIVYQCELGADLDGRVLTGHDLLHRSGGGGGDLGVDLVGGDLEQGLVHFDGVADLFE